jgi:hypothetical protein
MLRQAKKEKQYKEECNRCARLVKEKEPKLAECSGRIIKDTVRKQKPIPPCLCFIEREGKP